MVEGARQEPHVDEVTGVGYGDHLYLSTACLHGVHGECGRLQHDRGEPGAPHCKYCQAGYRCPRCRHGGQQPAPVAGRAFHSTHRLPATRSARLHIIRDSGDRAGQVGWCGVPASATLKSGPRVVIDPLPAVPPDGYTWCASCVGHFAELSGQLALFAALLAGPGR